MKKNTITWIYFTGLFLISGFPVFAQDFEVKAYLDRTSVGLNQQFTLHVELSGKGANSVQPELPEMDGFAAFLGSGSSQNIQIVNGRTSVSKIVSYYFQAAREGTFQIDPVTVTHKGKTYKTQPVSIQIQKAAGQSRSQPGQQEPVQGEGPAEGDLFIRTTVNKTKVYQNEPVIVTYKIYTRVNVTSFGFTDLPGTAGFWAEDFQQNQRPATHNEILEGKQYTVATIKKMALFPMSAGEKILDPLGVACEIQVSRRSRDLFDDFFNDPFGRTVRKTIQSKPVRIQVMPLPEESKPSDFSGVVGKYVVRSSIDKTKTRTNDAITYSLTIQGRGNIRTLPEPGISFSSDFETYPPKINESIQRQDNTISGTKTYEYVLIPRIAGIYTIQPVSWSYFDPEAKKYRTEKTEAYTIDVAQGDETFAITHSGLTKEEVKLLGQEIRFIKTDAEKFRKIGVRFRNPLLFLMVLFFPLFCFGGSLLYCRHLDRLSGDVAYARSRQAGRFAHKHLSTAKSLLNPGTQKEFYAEIGKALTKYLGGKLNIEEAGMMTDAVIKILEKKKVPEETRRCYFECLEICDMKRFSPAETTDEEMKVFFRKAEKALLMMEKEIA